MKGKIWVVGIGPGSPEYLTQKAIKAIEGSDIVAGYDLCLNAVRDLTHDKTIIEMTWSNRNERLDHITREVTSGKNCSILRSGDPNFSGSSGIEDIYDRFPDAEIISGISSVQIAAAKSKLAWGEIVLLTFHVSEDLEKKKQNLLDSVRGGLIVLLLSESRFMPKDVAKFLLSSSIDDKMPITVYENLTLENERVFHGNLKELTGKTFTYLSVVVIGK
ncbi:MAG TPA: precorrin-6y C5,15-methyltransferase (decarboxylating) subunit CbiE [Methanocellales archaeon]|nr:precorrin-6y C5,15-methyltransferase (decarboxylating) subunit CbiE [Methanocellales archaeon]